MTFLSGCASKPSESNKTVLDVAPVIDYYPLGGYTESSEGVFAVLRSGVPEVKESLKDIVINKTPLPLTFATNDTLNIVVMRGIFNTGGYGISIDRVERQGNVFAVHAVYTDPGEGMMVTQAFTQPTAIIPIGKLENGDYKATLKVTWIIENKEGKKVIETEKELMNFEFKVK